jgi:hypothetical protein
MVVPRVAMLAIIGALVIAAVAFFATRQSGDDGARTEGPAAPAAAPAKPAPEADASRSAMPAESSQGATRAKGDPTGGGTPASAEPGAVSAAQVPAPVSKALEDKQVVVLMFAQAGGADDRATQRRVRSLEAAGPRSLERRFQVFTDRVANLADYSAVLAGLGVSQAPATVVVAPDGEARLIEGFVDARSLRQYVADAL